MSVLGVELGDMEEERGKRVAVDSGDDRLACREASVAGMGTVILALTRLVEAGQRWVGEQSCRGMNLNYDSRSG